MWLKWRGRVLYTGIRKECSRVQKLTKVNLLVIMRPVQYVHLATVKKTVYATMQPPVPPLPPLSASMGGEDAGLASAVSRAVENRLAKKSIGSAERWCGVVLCSAVQFGRSSLSTVRMARAVASETTNLDRRTCLTGPPQGQRYRTPSVRRPRDCCCA